MNALLHDLPVTFWEEIINYKFWLKSIKVCDKKN